MPCARRRERPIEPARPPDPAGAPLVMGGPRISGALRGFLKEGPEAGPDALDQGSAGGERLPPALAHGALLLFMAVGLVVRLIPMVHWPLWIDEALTWSGTDATVADYLLWRHHPEHPPLYYVLSSMSLWLFGQSEWALRLPSMLASVACIPVGFYFVRGTLTTASALAFAALLAVDPVLVFQGHNARMYSLLALLTLLALWLTCHLCRREAGWRGWLLLGAVVGVSIWTHNLGLLLLIAVPAGLVLAGACLPRASAERGRWGRGALVAGAVASLFAAPILLNAAHRAKTGLVSEEPRLLDAARAAFGFLRRMTDIWWFDQLLFLAGLVGVLLLLRRRGPVGWLMAALMSLTVTFVVLAALKRPEAGLAKYLIPWKLCFLVGVSHLASIAVGRPRLERLACVAYTALAIACLNNLPLAAAGAFRAGEMVRDLPGQLGPQDEVICYPSFTEPLCRFYGIRPRQAPCEPERGPHSSAGRRRLWLVVAHARAGDAGLAGRIRSCAAEYGVTSGVPTDDFGGCHPSVMSVLIADGRVRIDCPDERMLGSAELASRGARSR